MRCASMVLTAVAMAWLVSCQSGLGQPGAVVQAFYDAALRGDTLTVQRHSTDGRGRSVGEVIRAATGAGAVKRVEVIRVDVWSEHGAHCEVRKTLADSATILVRIEVARKHGAWQVVSGAPEL